MSSPCQEKKTELGKNLWQWNVTHPGKDFPRVDIKYAKYVFKKTEKASKHEAKRSEGASLRLSSIKPTFRTVLHEDMDGTYIDPQWF